MVSQSPPVLSRLVLVASVAAAASPLRGAVRVVETSEAARLLPGISILDARARDAFEASHIPGARRVDWKEWTLEEPGLLNALFGHPARWGLVPPSDARLEGRLRDLGLSNARPVLVVGAPGGWGEEGRIAWNLLYWGAADVWLLDGGFRAWTADGGRPVERGKGRTPPPGDFTLHPRPERRIETAELEAALDARHATLLDVRTAAEFAGSRMHGQKRGGHLPGARLVPQESLYLPDGRFVGPGELARLTGLDAAKANDPRPRIVTYCTGGVRSALLAVLLEARLGIAATNYDGSLWAWSADPGLPLVK